VLATVARLGISADDKLLPELDLQLKPVARAISGLIRGLDALRDDAFPALASRLLEHLLAITLDGFGYTQLGRDTLADALHESDSALGPWLLDQDIITIHQDVE